ncbi:hypothetical protein AB0D12_37860 [Streptomyces sp. NPDC048479]|uniref:hypothetical protein n=1 Tax=Streptomyces sp. NPDC048479 TaxID=3154725 RepID=UPI0034401ACD
MRMALESGGLAPENIGLVYAHAMSTPQGDLAEATAVAEAMAVAEATGTHPAFTTTKSMTGHLLATS